MNMDKNFKNYALIIFDWDGTLMDSVGRIVSSMQSASRHCKLTIPTNTAVKSIIGLSLPVALGQLFPHLSTEECDEVIEQYKYEYREGDNTPTPLFENALGLLTALKDEQRILAVATGKGREGMQRVFGITDTEHYFNASRCAGEASSKPSPDMLLSLLAELGMTAEQAVVIGDTSHDMQMALSAGIDSIGITLGVDNRETLNKYQPVVVVDSLNELQQVLLPI